MVTASQYVLEVSSQFPVEQMFMVMGCIVSSCRTRHSTLGKDDGVAGGHGIFLRPLKNLATNWGFKW